jgi:hypothetical protein
MYIVLVGQSGKCRKGTAMNLGRDILKEISIPMTSECVTKEALIRSMSSTVDNFTDKGVIKFHCSMTAFSTELSVFLGQNDIRFLSDLTDWYDSMDSWKYETKNKGSDHIRGLCFNLLGATAPDWLQSILPQEAVGGGFTSRIIFIVAEKKGKTISNPSMTKEQERLRKLLVNDLNKISTLTGEFKFDNETTRLYSDWYEEQESNMERGIYAVQDPRFSGYCERRATHIKKLCMVMSASRGSDKIILAEDFIRSKALLEATEISMHKTFGGLGKSKYSDAVETILDYLILKRKVKRSEVISIFRRDIDPQTLKVVEEVLTGMKVMRVTIIPGAIDERIYEYIGPT